MFQSANVLQRPSEQKNEIFGTDISKIAPSAAPVTATPSTATGAARAKAFPEESPPLCLFTRLYAWCPHNSPVAEEEMATSRHTWAISAAMAPIQPPAQIPTTRPRARAPITLPTAEQRTW
ncbi:hypothetical protein MHYP_G00151490 [Metynnis hypsauchen]